MLLKLGGLFFIVSVVFWLWAIFDSLTCDDKRVRNLPRWAWVVVILLFLEFGALAWAIFGRPRSGQLVARGSSQPQASPRRPQAPPRGRPVGPDDDPEFLRNINRP